MDCVDESDATMLRCDDVARLSRLANWMYSKITKIVYICLVDAGLVDGLTSLCCVT